MSVRAAIAGSLAGAVLALAPATASAQEANYCKYGSRATLMLIDRTNPSDDTDQRVMLESFDAILAELGPGDRLEIATIGEHYSKSERVFGECHPGCPAGGIFSECSAVRAKKDAQGFKGKLAGAIQGLMKSPPETPKSDITGTIAQWTQHPPGGRAFTSVLVFSDMLENSQALPWTQFQTMTADKVMEVVGRYKLTPSVSKVDVHIVGFGRLHTPGRPLLPADLDARLREIWAAYFNAGGAQSVNFEGAIRR